jgi:HEAT repeat protein
VAAVWTLIAEGQIDRAEQRAQQVLASRPRSAAALAAAVAAAGAKGGSAAALGVYDRWIGSRTLEEPLVLRSLALVLLREEAKQDEDPVARGEALRALAREGERTTTGPADPAVSQMIADLQATPSSAQGMKFLEGLGAAGTPAALDALLSRADDERMEIRGAVASALANFPDDKARAQLNRLLGDRTAWVRARAAGALLKLGDQSGIGVLQTLAADTLPSMRLLAADELAARPDAAWQTLVRDLASSTDPAVSASAAGLLASFDPARAREVLDTLQKSENPAIQELARIKAGEATIETGTLTDLRLVLHAQEHIRRTRAAARILDLTR